jgi:hypothetical protein
MDYQVLKDYDRHRWKKYDIVAISDRYRKDAQRLIKGGFIRELLVQESKELRARIPK